MYVIIYCSKCMRFCFMDILQDDIDRCARKWNDHTVRPTKNAECPHGKPNILYALPQEKGSSIILSVYSMKSNNILL